tara:strand:+ start:704 stop:895 length:192 start_codon:yes stop_codon:yes gene_type:complete
MYISDNKIILELGGISVSRETLENMKEELDLKTDQEAENHLVMNTDGFALQYLERFQEEDCHL